MCFENYLIDHLVVRNKMSSTEYLCVEAIVDNPYEFLCVVQNSKYYVCYISWWDSVEIGKRSSIGYGGMQNLRQPDHYFAETDICRSFDDTTTIKEYFEYISTISQKYSNYNLFPAFDIKHRTGDGLREP